MMPIASQPDSHVEGSTQLWRSPSAWLRRQSLSRDFWKFFSAAFFFDAGFSIYFFLFNLYLLDLHYNERLIGLIGGAFTVGTLAGTLPAGVLAQRIGLRRMLAVCFGTASLFNAARVLWVWEPGQMVLAFLAGMAMSCWGVCFLPSVARLTTEENRTSAFSLIYSVSIGTSMLGGIGAGYLPVWCKAAGFSFQAADMKRLILLAACGVALFSFLPLLFVRIPAQSPEETEAPRSEKHWVQMLTCHPFLVRFIPLMALWAAILAAFTPFANVYLAGQLHIPLARIGVIFSSTQALQFSMGLLVPLVVRVVGLVNGIVATQVVTGLALFAMAVAGSRGIAIAFYLIFSAAQWASSPALYNLLMNETPDRQRSRAAAMTLFANALAGAVATAGTGALFTRFGYKPVLAGIAGGAFAVAILFRIAIGRRRLTQMSAVGIVCPEEGEG